MTSEELELSLRTEFENYLSSNLGALQQDVAEFQRTFEAEFAKHKSQMDEAIKALSSRLEETPPLDRGFTESVVEHLRLARDEGAELTATAFGEAEKLKEKAAPETRYDLLRDAISDIGSQLTQAAILRSLVDHASKFAPRGAFFIVKNEQFVGWRAFGSGVSISDEDVQGIKFAVASESLLSHAVNRLSTVDDVHGANSEDDLFLGPLDFGRPDRMYAIPLTARGRGVAVLYADYGIDGISLNLEALETLVNVAGLTVELRATAAAASLQAAVAPAESPAAPVEKSYAEPVGEHEGYSDESATEEVQEVQYEGFQEAAEPEVSESYSVQESAAVETDRPDFTETVEAPFTQYDDIPVQVETVNEELSYASPAVEFETSSGQESEAAENTGAVAFDESESAVDSERDTYVPETYQPEVVDFVQPEQPQQIEVERGYAEEQAEPEPSATVDAPAFGGYQQESFQTPNEPVSATETASDFSFTTEPLAEPAETTPAISLPEPAAFAPSGNGQVVEAAMPTAEGASQFRGRLRDRMIDLPIDVPEEERKLHNNARRFARLLVSEIKLYNEQKVVEGRQAGDLYDRLREAIDRSREMYDKRVESHVAAQFDYFHYELLNSLADGEASKLGASYPGAVV